MAFIFSIDCISKYRTELMGVAILGVMCGHLMNHTIQPQVLAHLARLIHTCGFLFLSGFGLYYSFSKNENVWFFFKKRISRLYIPYLCISSIFFVLLLLAGKCSVLQFIGYLTTAAFWYEGNYYAMWYIAVSLMLYLLFPLFYLLIFNKKWNTPLVLLVILEIVMYGMYYGLRHYVPEYWDLVEFGLSKTYIFPVGMYFGYLSKRGTKISTYMLLFFIICCGLLFINDFLPETMRTLIGIPLVCILFDCIFRSDNSKVIRKILLWLGNLSLELYLLHVLINFALKGGLGINHSWSMIIGIVSSLLICSPTSKLIRKISPKL